MKTKNIILFLIGLLAFSSCQDMFEPAELNNRQLEDLTEESKYAHGLLMYGYDRLPYLMTTTTDIATDDAVTNKKSGDYWNMAATGTWASDKNPMSQWDNCKDGIQYVNLFLSIVDQVKWAPSSTTKNQMFIDRLKGEAYGLRALLYYYLLMAHGGYGTDGVLYGVPLLTQPEDGSSDFNQPRATFAACVKQCFADCDNAIELLPADYKDIQSKEEIPEKYEKAQFAAYNQVFGSKSKNLISGKVVEAIKAQVALLAASPAFRDQSEVTSEDAALLCANVLKRIGGLNGFDNTGNVDWYHSAYKKMIEGTDEIPEILWRADRSTNADQEKENFPPSLYGNGRVNPSQNLVDAFPMRNGYPISDKLKSGYDEQDPYANRDPRLAETVIYNGATYRKADIITGKYANSADEVIDNFEQEAEKSTRTGYYLKKLLRDDVSPYSSSLVEQMHVYPRIRYTELFLAYAEAANDAWGPKTAPAEVGFTAYDVIKKIRERAGLGQDEFGKALPAGDAYLEECADDQVKMTELIRNERRIELCFENKRFWDLRRWLMPLNEQIKGMKVELIDKLKDPTPDNITYNIVPVEDRIFTHSDGSYQWYGPIPKSETLRWSNLQQNKGW